MKGLWIKQNVMALCYRQSCYPLKGNGNSTLRIYWWQPSKSWRWEYNPVNLEWIPLSPWRTDLQQIFQGVVWNAVLFPVSKIFPGFDSTKKRKLVLTIIKHEEIEVLIFLNSYKERKGWKKVDMWWSVRLEKEQHIKLFLMFKISFVYFYQYPIKINWVVSCNRALFDENRTWKTILSLICLMNIPSVIWMS